MITCTELLQSIKKKVTDSGTEFYSGKLMDATKEKAITVYPIKSVVPAVDVITTTKRDISGFSVLIHWGKLYTAAEQKAEEVRNILKNIEIDKRVIKKIDFDSGRAIPLGTDDRGIFEFVINLFILEEI